MRVADLPDDELVVFLEILQLRLCQVLEQNGPPEVLFDLGGLTGISFYNFPYTFGYLFSMGLYARAKNEGPSFLPKYESLLRATGSAPAERVARDALGVDLQDESFWQASLDLVESDVNSYCG